MRRRTTTRLITTSALALGLLLGSVSAAHGSFHIMKIREVGGQDATTNEEFVELQMYADGQNFVAGHSVSSYDAMGNPLATFTFPEVGGPGTPDVANGQNQATILVGDTGVAARDFTQNFMLSDTGGAVCFIDNIAMNTGIDCMSWGTFDGTITGGNPSPIGPNFAANIPDFGSLDRRITQGCATALDEPDDTNNSATDFLASAPTPRSNSTTPTESLCLSPPLTPASPPGNPTSPINPAGNVRKRKCKKSNRAAAAKKKKCKKKKK